MYNHTYCESKFLYTLSITNIGAVHQRTELVGIESIRAFIYNKCYISYIIGKSMSSTRSLSSINPNPRLLNNQ